MSKRIDFSHGKPIYIRIYERFRDEIISGVYRYGEKLPSKRTISMEYDVSVISTEHALALLEEEGYVESAERRGYFVTYKKSDAFFSHTTENLFALPSVSDEPQGAYFPFSVLAKAMRKVLSDYGELLYVKCPSKGAAVLRESISRFLLRNKNIKAAPEQIVIGSGAEWLYMMIVQIAGKDKIIATEDPSYEKIAMIYKANGARTEPLRLGSDGILTSELKRSRADLLHVTPYRSYPTGITTSGAKKREYLEWADAGDRLIIEDDYLSEYSVSMKPEETIFSIDPGKKVIYVNSFAQTVCPTIRVGYAVLPESLLGIYDDAVGFYSSPVPAFEQYVLAEIIGNGDFERHLNRVRRKRRNGEQP